LLGVHRLLKYKRKLAKRSRDADETLFVRRCILLLSAAELTGCEMIEDTLR
jgi:hypothetical protein